MRDSEVRTRRPLSLTSNIVVRPIGPLDAACAEELRDAVEYVMARPGGLIIVDCSGVSSVSAAGTSVLDWVEQTSRSDRVVQLRQRPQDEEAIDRSAEGSEPSDVADPTSRRGADEESGPHA